MLEKTGRVRSFANQPSAASSSVFLDLSGVVNTASEGGLLGLAFAPDYATSRIAYLSYTRTPAGGGMQSVISRFRSTDGGQTLDPAAEQVLLTIDQPYNNHNGGNIKFGPDGHLYIAIGDGGSGGGAVAGARDRTAQRRPALPADRSDRQPAAHPGRDRTAVAAAGCGSHGLAGVA